MASDEGKIYVGQGVDMKLTVQKDISGATTFEMEFWVDNGVAVTKTAERLAGTNTVRYQFADSDITTAGVGHWRAVVDGIGSTIYRERIYPYKEDTD